MDVVYTCARLLTHVVENKTASSYCLGGAQTYFFRVGTACMHVEGLWLLFTSPLHIAFASERSPALGRDIR